MDIRESSASYPGLGRLTKVPMPVWWGMCGSLFPRGLSPFRMASAKRNDDVYTGSRTCAGRATLKNVANTKTAAGHPMGTRLGQRLIEAAFSSV